MSTSEDHTVTIAAAAIHTIRNRRHLLTWRRRLAWWKPWFQASVARRDT